MEQCVRRDARPFLGTAGAEPPMPPCNRHPNSNSVIPPYYVGTACLRRATALLTPAQEDVFKQSQRHLELEGMLEAAMQGVVARSVV